MMKNALYGGVNTAVLTPMRNDLTPDLDMLAKRCRWLLANGTNGLAVLGTTGEGNSLGVDERLDFLEGLAERRIPGRLLLPGVGTTAIPDTVKLVQWATKIGCRGVLVLPPFCYRNPSEDGLFAYFSEVIDRAGTDTHLYLYHIPVQSAIPFTIPLVGRLLKAFPGTIRGIKDSSGDLANTLAYVEHFAKDGFEVYCGDDGALHELLKAGGAGCITGASNITCAENARVYANVGTPTAARSGTARSLPDAVCPTDPERPRRVRGGCPRRGSSRRYGGRIVGVPSRAPPLRHRDHLRGPRPRSHDRRHRSCHY